VTGSVRVRYGRPAPLAVATFVLALLTTVTTLLIAKWWAPIDAVFITRAEEAGWNAGLLLPRQQELWLAVAAATALSLGLTIVSVLAMRASRLPAPPSSTTSVLGPEGTLV
jgi:hypothetical protein